MAEGKHWFKNGENWDIQPCSRINEKSNCQHCSFLDSLIKALPRIDSKKEYSEAVNDLKNANRPLVVAVAYNFPIINRETEEYGVFSATPGLRSKIEAEHALGIKVMDVDFIAMNTGGNGKEKYALTRVDKSDTIPLTEKEVAIKEKFKVTDFMQDFDGTQDSESGVAIDANSEVRDDGDVPF